MQLFNDIGQTTTRMLSEKFDVIFLREVFFPDEVPIASGPDSSFDQVCREQKERGSDLNVQRIDIFRSSFVVIVDFNYLLFYFIQTVMVRIETIFGSFFDFMNER